MKTAYFLLTFLSLTYCLYDKTSKVQLLNQNDFRTKVIGGRGLWLVEFFAPWCGHCKNLAPEYEKVARAFEGILNIAAVDMDANPSVGQPYDVKGFPTIKLFSEDKNKPIDYQGERTAQAISDWLIAQTKTAVQSRLSGRSKQQNNERQNRRDKPNENQGGSGGSSGEVIVLEDSTFDENVLGSKDSWFVEFYAPWCGHCKKLEPEWNKLAGDLQGEVKVAKVDATVNSKVAQRFGVSGYPTIKFFPAGMTSDSQIVDYSGGRDASSMASWAREQGEKFKPLQLTQLISQTVFDDYCKNYQGWKFQFIFKGVCVVLFLPHIYDSNKQERDEYLKVYEETAAKLKGKPIQYLWAQGGDYYETEEAFQLTSGYPSVLAISYKKNLFAKMRGVFKQETLESFLKGVLAGRESFYNFKQEPKIKTVTAWDGKDHKPQNTDDDL